MSRFQIVFALAWVFGIVAIAQLTPKVFAAVGALVYTILFGLLAQWRGDLWR